MAALDEAKNESAQSLDVVERDERGEREMGDHFLRVRVSLLLNTLER